MELLSASYVNQKFPMHSHNAYCIGILEEGSQILSFAKNNLIVPSNSIIMINPNEVHANYALDENGWKYKMMYVNSDVVKYIYSLYWISKCKNIRFKYYTLQDDFIFNLIKSFFNSFENTSFENLEHQLKRILSHLITNYATNTEEQEQVHQNSINELKHILDEKFDTKLNLDNISKSLGINKFKTIRAFKKSTGMTPFSYVLQKRIEKSKILISQNVKLSHVALESGFYDQSHFSKYFKNYVGVTPISYFKSCNILQDFNK
ncbi:hypothetical protein DS884_10290 [Tenacibaculum sp. E3R01]|uniref:AraC family transcriptional regulator n=1 Tax=Tenacibaculum sp. E3R01 TaxID=2267227 RepID=UPI000DEAD1BD|nr:AraC family transcriptional regulator [Tenacibaculum sp. E3R01]RBW58238.1 hypothetical protein DS884_10290 [Tenacibaculum sp. E3R01]